jgi:hypothetical protein
LDVLRQRLNYPELKRAIIPLYGSPTIVFEDKNSGTQLIRDLRPEGILDVSRASPPNSTTQALAISTSLTLPPNISRHSAMKMCSGSWAVMATAREFESPARQVVRTSGGGFAAICQRRYGNCLPAATRSTMSLSNVARAGLGAGHACDGERRQNARPSFAPTTQLGIAILCGAVTQHGEDRWRSEVRIPSGPPGSPRKST